MTPITNLVTSALLLFGGLEDGAHFVPEAVGAHWDGRVATVTFQEAGVELDADLTTISVTVTADLEAVCRRDDSTITVRRSATALAAEDHPISEDGLVEATVALPLRVTRPSTPGYTCDAPLVSVTVVLEDFWTGATLTHQI